MLAHVNNTYQDISQRHSIAHIVRKQSEPYMRSNKKTDNDQGNILLNISDDIMSNNLEMACLRLDALHRDIKTSLPFQVLDFLNKAELHLSN
jgi:transcription initiation factor TFIID subunit TAF12